MCQCEGYESHECMYNVRYTDNLPTPDAQRPNYYIMVTCVSYIQWYKASCSHSTNHIWSSSQEGGKLPLCLCTCTHSRLPCCSPLLANLFSLSVYLSLILTSLIKSTNTSLYVFTEAHICVYVLELEYFVATIKKILMQAGITLISQRFRAKRDNLNTPLP